MCTLDSPTIFHSSQFQMRRSGLSQTNRTPHLSITTLILCTPKKGRPMRRKPVDQQQQEQKIKIKFNKIPMKSTIEKCNPCLLSIPRRLHILPLIIGCLQHHILFLVFFHHILPGREIWQRRKYHTPDKVVQARQNVHRILDIEITGIVQVLVAVHFFDRQPEVFNHAIPGIKGVFVRGRNQNPPSSRISVPFPAHLLDGLLGLNGVGWLTSQALTWILIAYA